MRNRATPIGPLRFLIWLIAGVSLLLTLGGLSVGMVVGRLVQAGSAHSSAVNMPFLVMTAVIFALSAATIIFTRRRVRPQGD